MNKRQIEQRLGRAGTQLPLPGFETIADTPVHRMEEQDYITRQTPPGRRGRPAGRVLRSAGAVCALLLAMAAGWFAAMHQVDSLVYLDVNPSIRIAADRGQRVLRVTPLNQAAQTLLGETAEAYKGQPLEEAVGRLAERLAEGGYLSAQNRAVLLSVQNSDGQRALRLEEELTAAMESRLAPQGIHPAILCQRLAQDRQAEEQAAAYGISPGKLWYARQILAGTDDYTLEQLAGMKLEQLAALARDEEEEAEELEGEEAQEAAGGHGETEEPEKTEEPNEADSQPGRELEEEGEEPQEEKPDSEEEWEDGRQEHPDPEEEEEDDPQEAGAEDD